MSVDTKHIDQLSKRGDIVFDELGNLIYSVDVDESVNKVKVNIHLYLLFVKFKYF